jgi:hypothetical protein
VALIRWRQHASLKEDSVRERPPSVTGCSSRILLALAVSASACGLPSGSTTPTTVATGTTETFSGQLAPQASDVYMFTVSQAGAVSITLASLSPSATVAVGLGLGTPNGTTSCTLTSSNPTAMAGSAPQITVTENPGSYCVEIYDVGNLTSTSTFSITIVHP